MIGPEIVGGGACEGQTDLEEDDYKYVEDPGVDIQQVFHVPPNLVEPIRHVTCRCQCFTFMQMNCDRLHGRLLVNHYLVTTYYLHSRC
jgi:hypothetical protein